MELKSNQSTNNQTPKIPDKKYRFEVIVPGHQSIPQDSMETISKELEAVVKKYLKQEHTIKKFKPKSELKTAVSTTQNEPTNNQTRAYMHEHNVTFEQAVHALKAQT